MSGRGGRGGRGRGGGKPMSLNIEALGFGRGEALPTASVQPPPEFPPLEHHPLPLEHNEKYSYLVDLKRYFQTSMEDSPYHIKRLEGKKDIHRYSDKYKVSNTSSQSEMILYSRMPEELRPQKKKKMKRSKKTVSAQAIHKTISDLEKKEEEVGKAESGDEAADSDEEKSGDEEKEGDEEVEMDEEEMEEENDYIQEYFDNGEGFGDPDDDGLDDGPVY